MLPDIAELEYVRKEETRPRVGDTNPPRLGGEVTSEPEGVDISQDEEDTGHQDGIDLSGRPSPCVVEHIKIEEFQEEENPVARNEDAASNDESRPGRTEDHEVDELLKEGNVFPKESHDQNQKKRNKRKSSPKSPKRKKQKSALDVESNPDQPPLLSQKEGEVEEEDVLSCEMCGQLFPETEEFSRHIETDHDHQCQEDGCGLSFTHEYYLHLHEADVHKTRPPPNASLRPEEEKAQSPNSPLIALNKSLIESTGFESTVDLSSTYEESLNASSAQYKCDDCTEAFSTSRELYEHRNESHYIVEQASSSQAYLPSLTCTFPSCSEVFENGEKLKKHFSKVHEVKKEKVKRSSTYHLRCSLCRKTFSSENKLLEHQKIEHKYKCDQCSRSYILNPDLLHHNLKYHDKRRMTMS